MRIMGEKASEGFAGGVARSQNACKKKTEVVGLAAAAAAAVETISPAPAVFPGGAEGLFFPLLCVAERLLSNRCFFFFFLPLSELVALTRAFL